MQTLLMDYFLAYSKCATDKKQKAFLYKILGNKQLFTGLVYSGSIHGWKAKDFHYRSN